MRLNRPIPPDATRNLGLVNQVPHHLPGYIVDLQAYRAGFGQTILNLRGRIEGAGSF